jgi:NADH-quinone oxidoreductase subunit F
MFEPRVLPVAPYTTLEDYMAAGGGAGLDAARALDAEAIIAEVEASGLRGRGGAGFPTGTKWRTVAGYASPTLPTTVVINGAEGEPGTFKDRAILRANPYAVIEGALIAAHALSAPEVIFALKSTFRTELDRLRIALAEVETAGWSAGIKVNVFEGPGEYLYGEESGLFEAVDGRPPLPRIAPPYRRGVDEVYQHPGDEHDDERGLSAHVDMATPDGETPAPPTLAQNVETAANVPGIIAKGASWFREVGTEQSPGTIVCTITGAVTTEGVGEIAMGSTLRDAIDTIGGGVFNDHGVAAVMSGVSTGLLPGDRLDTPLTYEDMAAAGSGLGSAGFIVIDDRTDVVSIVAGASRFLAVESCGQCAPCKRDGLDVAAALARLSRSEAEDGDVALLRDACDTISVGARCALARQHEAIIRSLLECFGPALDAHAAVPPAAPAVEPALVAALVDIEGSVAVRDTHHADKQPDWTYNDEDSGKWPADRL